MTYKIEVIADGSGHWAGNALTFETKAEAEAYAIDLALRWTSVRDWRVVTVEPPETPETPPETPETPEPPEVELPGNRRTP